MKTLETLAVLMVFASPIPRLASIGAQAFPPAFRTGVAVVPISAVVRDSRNRIVRDLVRDDFHVRENGRIRQIVDFRATDTAPLSLALLVDTSGSMRGTNLDRGKEVVGRLLNRLDSTLDEVALFTFDRALRQETPFTNDFDRIRKALETTKAWGLTSLYDAIAETAERIADRRFQRRALIVVTDGVDTSSSLTPAEVSGLASAIDVPVYIVAVEPPRRPGMNDDDGDADLSHLAYWTGGDLGHAATPEDADKAVKALIAELRQQYFLAIESATTSGWYRLDVKTRRRGLTVRARSGYFAPRIAQTGSGS